MSVGRGRNWFEFGSDESSICVEIDSSGDKELVFISFCVNKRTCPIIDDEPSLGSRKTCRAVPTVPMITSKTERIVFHTFLTFPLSNLSKPSFDSGALSHVSLIVI